jgi:hypothetical protein
MLGSMLHDMGGFGRVHLGIFSRVWMGRDPCRHDNCRDGRGVGQVDV